MLTLNLVENHNTTNNFSEPNSDEEVDAFDQLLPTLVECFIIIFCGYLAAKFKFIPKKEAKGMNYFTANLAMPAMVFIHLASIDIHKVNWSFFLAILMSKALIFALVIFVTSIIYRPVNFSVAAIYAIFTTHANDFGLGYPIFNSLYAKDNPLYPGYIYLIGQISLVVLNPIAFVLLEVDRARGQNRGHMDAKRSCGIVLKVIWKITSNPNVWMTALAIVVNLCFYNKVPKIINNVLFNFSSAFQSLVLFLLGICVVGSGKTKSQQSLIIALLLVVKILVTPLVTRAAVQLLCWQAFDRKTLSDYGFLYGTIPTAPVVLLYAIEFGLSTDLLAAALVLCTLVSGPVMYVSTRMITVQIYNIAQYVDQLKETLFYISVFGLISSVWVGAMLIINGWWKRPPYSVVEALLLSQVITCLGVLAWTLSAGTQTWSIYLQIFSITGGLLATRFWTALLAITIMLMHRHTDIQLSFMKCYYVLFGFGIPAALISGLMLTNGLDSVASTINYSVPSFLYGQSEACVSLVVVIFCLVTTVICLVMYSRDKQMFANTPPQTINVAVMRKLSIIREESFTETGLDTRADKTVISMDNPGNGKENRTRRTSVSWENKNLDSTTCTNNTQSSFNREDLKPFPHIILLLLQCISMTVAIIVVVWRLLADDQSGIYIAIEFLDVVLMFGQGVYCLLVYGHCSSEIIPPILKLWSKVTRKTFQIPTNIDEKAFINCNQFLTYHLHDFSESLTLTRDSKGHRSQVFSEDELTRWLVKESIARKAEDAEKYFNHLCAGNVLVPYESNCESSKSYCFNSNIQRR